MVFFIIEIFRLFLKFEPPFSIVYGKSSFYVISLDYCNLTNIRDRLIFAILEDSLDARKLVCTNKTIPIKTQYRNWKFGKINVREYIRPVQNANICMREYLLGYSDCFIYVYVHLQWNLYEATVKGKFYQYNLKASKRWCDHPNKATWKI